jgi:hypothetical protein
MAGTKTEQKEVNKSDIICSKAIDSSFHLCLVACGGVSFGLLLRS